MGKTSLYKKKYHIDLRDVDFRRELKLSTLFTYFEDVASLAVDDLGIGINTLQEKFGVAWILIRMRVDIIRIPKYDEVITIETWPQLPKSLEFDRDFIIRDSSGDIIVKAISTWIIFDINTRRIKRSRLIAINYPDLIEERAINSELNKLNSYGALEFVYNRVIGYSDIDFNGHLNNSKYIDFSVDCYLFEKHQMYRVKSVEVNFIHETLPGEQLVMYKDISKITENCIYIEGINKKDQKAAFKTRVVIEER